VKPHSGGRSQKTLSKVDINELLRDIYRPGWRIAPAPTILEACRPPSVPRGTAPGDLPHPAAPDQPHPPQGVTMNHKLVVTALLADTLAACQANPVSGPKQL